MDLTETLTGFRRFLTAAWPVMLDLADLAGWDDDPYFVDHWQQANWEVLVERPLLGNGHFLTPYGSMREDPNIRHGSRGSRATHRVVCIDKRSPESTAYPFLCFVTLRNGAVWSDVPFDHVSASSANSRKPVHFAVSQVDFRLDLIAGP